MWRYRFSFKTMLVSFIALLALTGIGFGALWYNYDSWMKTPLNISGDGLSLEIAKGQSISHIALKLADENRLNHPKWLTWTARHQRLEKIHSGEYFIKVGSTPVDLLNQLNKGGVVMRQVTLVEGWTFAQWVKSLESANGLIHLLPNKTLEEQLKLLGIEITHPEGWFFPDTYSYTKGMSDVDVLRLAYKAMQKILLEEWEARAQNLPYRTPYDALIMASIVEKETGDASERDKIAGVFVRRLQQGIRLQTDPTVIYGLGNRYTGNITKNDLSSSTPYNTYVIDRLPPTPIAMPSRSAINAALHPDDSKNLYFVAKGDGTSEFTATLADHQRAVARFQLRRKEGYRSAPPSEKRPQEK